MSRRILLLTTIISFLLLSSCSYRYDFVVVNESEGPIEVQYTLKRRPSGQFADNHPPAELTIQEFQKSKPEWRNLMSGEYIWDNSTGTFIIIVACGGVLLVDSTTGGEDAFALESIKITGSKGSVSLEGQQAHTQFKSESDQKFVLRYR
jgi:hypothetical protein